MKMPNHVKALVNSSKMKEESKEENQKDKLSSSEDL